MARSQQHRRDDDYPRDRRDDRYQRRSPSRERRHDHRDGDRDRDRRHRDDTDRDRYSSRRNGRNERDGRDTRDGRDGRDGRDVRDDGRYRDRSRGSRRKDEYREKSPVRDDRRDRRRERNGDDYGDRGSNKRVKREDDHSREGSRPTTANRDARPAPVDEATVQAQQERQAKLEMWKKKLQEKHPVESLKTAESSPAVKSPTEPSRPTTADGSVAPSEEEEPDLLPRAKFDHKAIKKRTDAAMAKAKSGKATLGNDAVIPTNALTNKARATNVPMGVPTGAAAAALSKDARIAGFGLNKAAVSDKLSTKMTTALDEDEAQKREIQMLPSLPQDSISSDAAATPGQVDQDDMELDLRSDEEEAEAAREAAHKRAEEAQAEDQNVTMRDAPEPLSTNADVDMDQTATITEDLDPLEAFMHNLGDSMDQKRGPEIGKRANREVQLFDEDGPDLEAVGDDPEDLLKNPKKRKKELPVVKHSTIAYEDFRKNFYSESIEVAEMSAEEVEKLRADMDNITVRGLDQPKPIVKWSQCGFGAQILDVIQKQKFAAPTSIQCQALPTIMSGRDTIGIAKTGSGKTLAFILPMFRHIKDQRPVANLEGPIGLIMAPTRELAVQIHRECKPYLKALNLRGVCAYGGTPIKDQIAELKRGAEVVVCTPGRLIDLLIANAGRVTNLRRVTYVVMDEADRMFDMGFEPQITKILDSIRPDRQTVTFSATFPKKMETLARKALSKPLEILVGGRSVVAAEITQKIEVREEDTKFHRVLELLGELFEGDEDARTLIFVEKQESADNLLMKLGKKSYPALSVHGGREQIDRDQAILDFKAGHVPIMVATSVAARGLDVKQLKLVINYDSPNHGEDYVHRAGRTGRAGNTGTAVTFVTPEQERFASFLVRALEDSKQEVPQVLQDMASSHKKKVQSGEAMYAGSGFGGRGIERMDAARAAERAREKSLHKIEDEPEEEDDDDKQKKEKAAKDLVAKATGAVKDRDAPVEKSAEVAKPAESVIDRRLAEHLSNALKVQKVEKEEASGMIIKDPLARAAAAAAGINSRLGRGTQAGPSRPADNRGPDAGAYHATLEMNDFPQKARWAVTNRTNVAKILDATGTSITSKGIYYPPGKEPAPGEQPKLYILVEGDTEVAVENAMRELSRHLTEGTLAAANEGDGRAPGRYRVV